MRLRERRNPDNLKRLSGEAIFDPMAKPDGSTWVT